MHPHRPRRDAAATHKPNALPAGVAAKAPTIKVREQEGPETAGESRRSTVYVARADSSRRRQEVQDACGPSAPRKFIGIRKAGVAGLANTSSNTPLLAPRDPIDPRRTPSPRSGSERRATRASSGWVAVDDLSAAHPSTSPTSCTPTTVTKTTVKMPGKWRTRG